MDIIETVLIIIIWVAIWEFLSIALELCFKDKSYQAICYLFIVIGSIVLLKYNERLH